MNECLIEVNIKRTSPDHGEADDPLGSFRGGCRVGRWTILDPRGASLPKGAAVLLSVVSLDHYCSFVHGKILPGKANGIYRPSNNALLDRMCMNHVGHMSYPGTK